MGPTTGVNAGEVAQRWAATLALNSTQAQVLLQILYGRTNAEIQVHLGISEKTLKTAIGELLDRTATRDKVGLILHVLEVT